jgi:magnesium transporter
MAKRKRRRQRHSFTERTNDPPEILVAEPGAAMPEITFTGFSADDFQELDILDIATIKPLVEKWPICWLNIDGLGDAKIVGDIGDIFDFHHLALEDVLHPVQRAKVELYPDYVFAVIRMLIDQHSPETEQLSIFLGKNYVITFQEQPGGDILDPLRERIRKKRGIIREMGADYLMYAIIDTVTDAYFPVLEDYGEKLDEIEDKIFEKGQKELAKKVHGLKRDIVTIRRAVWPLRDAIATLYRDPIPFISQETRYHLRDCQDHVLRIMDLIETSREYAQDLTDLYLSSVSQRMNEVMKVLTIITTVIMAPTLVAGVYGMNFNPAVSPWNMPELNWVFGYPMALSMMAGVALTALLYFRLRGWLGSNESRAAESNGQQTPHQAQPIEQAATAPGGNSKD